jgi:hypothetical protein
VITTSTLEELHNDLTALFLSAYETVYERLLDLPEGPCSSDMVMVIHRDGPQDWGDDYRQVRRNSLLSSAGQAALAPWLDQSEITQASNCAEALAEVARDTLPFWSSFTDSSWQLIMSPEAASHDWEKPGGFAQDPARWVTRHLVLPALKQNLEALPCLDDQIHHDAAQAFAREVLSVATSTNLQYVSVVPLSGVDLSEATGDVLTEADVTIRRLSDVDQAMWLNEFGGLTSALWSYEPPCVALELRTTGPRNAQHMSASARVPSLITAFHLHGHCVAGKFAVEYSDPSWVFPGSVRKPLVLPDHAQEPSVLTADEVRCVIATAGRLDRFNIAQPQSPKDLALHRFMSGAARNNDTDAVLDFTIALEALLLPYDSDTRRGDLGYRFRMHGACFLEDDTAERTVIFRRLRDVYDMRSRLVHGGGYPEASEIRIAREDAHDFARRGLLRAVHGRFPDVEAFRRMLLGLASS